MVKNPPANAGDTRDVGSIPGSGRFPGGGYGNLLQYYSLENPMDRGAWRVTVHRVEKRWTYLSNLACKLVKSDLLHLQFGEGNGNPLQYSCLENPMDGGAW